MDWLFGHSSPSEGRRRWQEEQRRKNFWRFLILAVLIILPLVISIPYFWQQRAVTTELEISEKTITVRRGGNFQAALNQAKPGDTIILEAGAQFVGSFELPNKEGAEYITIQSSALDRLPGENVRVQTEHAELMPKILSSGKGAPAIYTAPRAHHYRFVGIEFSGANNDYIYNMIMLGSEEQKAAEIPHHFEFDRCIVRSQGLGKARRGFALNNGETVIKNSRVLGFAGEQDETQAIAGWSGPGPYKIINNHLEGGGENILIGGGDPTIKDLVPSDIEIRNNLITKPEHWRRQVTLKNLLELKNARRVQIVGNIFENCWDCGALVLTVRNQNNTAPWSTIEDVEIRNNLVRGAYYAVNILGRDDTNSSQKMKRVKIINNLFEEIDSQKFGLNDSSAYFLQIADADDIEIAYNTVFNDGNMINMHRAPSRRVSFRYNVLPYNNYGVLGDGSGVHNFAKFFPDATVVGNVVVNSRKLERGDISFPGKNFLAMNFGEVGFSNQAKRDYRLAANSRFKGKAENGKDIGCDFDALMAAINGVETSAQPLTVK